MFISETRLLTIGMALTLANLTPSPQGPTRAEIDRKTSGLVKALASPGDLAAPTVPGATSDLEKLLSDVGAKTKRGTSLPDLQLFVQYASGDNADGGRIVDAVNVPALVANDSVKAVELQRPPSFQPEAVRPFNRDARRTHHVGEFVAKYPGFEGAGRMAAVIDAGAVLPTHREFEIPGPPISSKIRVLTQSEPDQHATHVAGTIAASGIDPRAKGMAPAASIVSLDFSGDLEKFAALTEPVNVTNHSYGPYAGWDYDPRSGWHWWGDRALSEDEDATFGKYTARASVLDSLLAAPQRAEWLPFIAAGNDRNDGPQVQPVSHYAITIVNGRPQWQVSGRSRRADGGDRGGIDTVSGLCLAKNVICVGAIHDAQAGMAFATTEFSAWGPADDGRVKPDLVANGQNLLSTSNADIDAYVEMPGTSMASPAAAGIGLIIGQAFQKGRGRNPVATELKAVLIHSARDAGRPGPDVEFGWGVIDALAAGDVVMQTDRHIIDSFDIGAAPVTLNMTSDGGPIRATLVWQDPEGAANTGGLDDATPALQNNIDLELVAPGGNVFYPYRLDRANPLQDAKRDGANSVDNVEVVDASGANGAWQIRVRPRLMAGGVSQRVTLVTSGLRRTP